MSRLEITDKVVKHKSGTPAGSHPVRTGPYRQSSISSSQELFLSQSCREYVNIMEQE